MRIMEGRQRLRLGDCECRRDHKSECVADENGECGRDRERERGRNTVWERRWEKM